MPNADAPEHRDESEDEPTGLPDEEHDDEISPLGVPDEAEPEHDPSELPGDPGEGEGDTAG